MWSLSVISYVRIMRTRGESRQLLREYIYLGILVYGRCLCTRGAVSYLFLPRATLKPRRTHLRVSGGARCVTYRQPDHSSGFVMKGQCGAVAVACVFRVQSITLRGAGRMPKMGLLMSLKKIILQRWLSFRCCGNV